MSLTKATYSMTSGAPVNVLDYGADPTGATNSTSAFAAAAAAIQSAGGGTLVIPFGTYIVGSQTFVHNNDWCYAPADIIAISNCTKPIVIEGNGAILKAADGLKFGSFNPSTGLPYTPGSLPFTDPKYAAGVYKMINLVDNTGPISIRNLELDGNIANAVLGGQWGDQGIQLQYTGIQLIGNNQVNIENVNSHHHGLDGLIIGWPGLTNAVSRPHTVLNSTFNYNGRQGMSVVGSNLLSCINCDFSFTGKNGYVATPPGSGVDLEAEGSIVVNSSFDGCRFYNNTGAGLVTDGGSVAYATFKGCSFIGTTSWSLYGNNPYFSYFGCTIVGACTAIYGDVSVPTRASKFVDCTFAMIESWSPNATIYGSRQLLDGANVTFVSCGFLCDDAGHALPNTATTTKFTDCTMYGLGSTSSNIYGQFFGKTVIFDTSTWNTSIGVDYFNYGMMLKNNSPLAASFYKTTTASAPAYYKGAVYFDTTLNKLRIGGATGWETVTST